MKKPALLILVLTLLVAASCKKSTDPGGVWAFEGANYGASTCIALPGASGYSTLVATAAGGSTLTCYFNGDSLPKISNTYTVVSGRNPPSGTVPQIGISFITGGSSPVTYYSTGGNGTEPVSVTLSSGKIYVSGSGIEMLNNGNASDSSALILNLSQQ